MCERERFEAWVRSQAYSTETHDGEYDCPMTSDLWQVWQAACPEGDGAISVSETAPLGTTAALKRVKKERDALTAHVERLRERRAETPEQDCHQIIDEWLEAKPQSSLARRDLLKQAENWTPADLFKKGDGEWGQREGNYYVTRSYKDGKLIRTVYHELNDLETK